MSVSGVDNQDVNSGINQSHGSFPGIVANSNRCRDQKSTGTVLRGQRVFVALVEIFDGDQAGESAVVVD